MKNKYKIILILAIILIVVFIAIKIIINWSYDVMFEETLIGEFAVDESAQIQDTGQAIYFYADKSDITESEVLEAYNAADYILKIRDEYGIAEEINSEYILISVGSKIKEVAIANKTDINMSGPKESPYLVTVEYEADYNPDILYIYKIKSSENNFQFAKIFSKLETYREDEKIRLVQTYENSIDLLFYRIGAAVPIPVKEKHTNPHDPVVETNINYYYFKEPYLYTISRWGRYMVINTSNYKVLERTYEYDEISSKHREVFDNIEQFNDVSYINNQNISNTIEILESPIIINLSTYRSGVSEIDLLNIKARMTMHYIPEVIFRSINNILVKDDLIFVVDEANKYYVVNKENGEIIFESNSLDEFENIYIEVFEEVSGFYTIEDIQRMIEEDTKYIE